MKYVIFDMDGVLFDTESITLQCWLKVCEPYGLKNVKETFIRCVGTNEVTTEKIFLEEYGPKYPIHQIKVDEEELVRQTIRKEGPIKKPYSEYILQELTKCGFEIALASSTDEADVRHEIKMAGFDKYFKHVIGGDKVSNGKPDPEIFLKAAAMLGCDPKDAFIIEDSYNGIRAAHKAGAKPIMVPDMLPATDEMRCLAVSVQKDLKGAFEYILANS